MIKYVVILFVCLFVCNGNQIDSNIKTVINDDIKSQNPKVAKKLKPLYDQLKKDPLNKQLYNNIGDIYYKARNLDNAKMMFEYAVRIDSNYVPALFNLSIIATRLQEYDQAINYLLKVYELEPANIKAVNNLSQLYYKQNKLEKSIEFATLAFNSDPKNSNYAYNLGVVYQAIGEYDLAIEYYEKTLEIEPEYISATDRIKSIMHYKKNNE